MSSPMTEIQAVPGAQEVPGAKFCRQLRRTLGAGDRHSSVERVRSCPVWPAILFHSNPTTSAVAHGSVDAGRIRINERNHGNIRRERGKVKHKQRAEDPSTPLDARAEKKVVTRTSRMSSPCNRHANSMAGFCAAVSPEASKMAADPGARGKGQDMAWHH